MNAYEQITQINFPKSTNININMMPIMADDPDSIPDFCKPYIPLIQETGLEGIAYLTINESMVAPGQTQRRPGIHTDGTKIHAFGGGGWGGGAWGGGSAPPKPVPKPKPKDGIFMASNDGLCRFWNELNYNSDDLGAVSGLKTSPLVMNANMLYWITDRTPHESLPSPDNHMRQFFRLVSGDVSVWWDQHSTRNPLGIQPNCKINYGSKF